MQASENELSGASPGTVRDEALGRESEALEAGLVLVFSVQCPVTFQMFGTAGVEHHIRFFERSPACQDAGAVLVLEPENVQAKELVVRIRGLTKEA